MNKQVENMPVNGEPTVFESGAKRDNQVGKGRVDLMPLFVAEELINKYTDNKTLGILLGNIETFQRHGDGEILLDTIHIFSSVAYGSIHTALIEVGHRYEAGGVKYGDRNWEQGVPLHVYVNSSIRHLLKYYRGDEDEDHAGAVIWNLLNLIHTYRTNLAMNDLPMEKERIYSESLEDLFEEFENR